MHPLYCLRLYAEGQKCSVFVSGYRNKHDGRSVTHENICLSFGPGCLSPSSDPIKQTHHILLIHKSCTLLPISIDKRSRKV